MLNQRLQNKTNKMKKSYRVDVRLPDGRRISKSFKRKVDASAFRAQLKLDAEQILNTGVSIRDDITFDRFARQWFENEVLGRKAHKTQLCYKCDLKNHIIPVVGKYKLKDITFNHARKLENSVLQKNKSNRTANKVMMIFKMILNDAVKTNNILKNPIKGYSELTEHPRDITYWSKDQAKQFLDANREHENYELYAVTLNLGLRLGEVLGLCWDKVDFESNNITISRTLSRGGLQNTTKNHESRYLPMNTLVRGILLKRRERGIKGQIVFCRDDGRPLPYDHVTNRTFKKAQLKAGLETTIRFHDLRHTFASHFMMNGGNIYTLQQILGHKDIKTTMIYAHLDKEFLRQATEIVQFQ